MEFLEVIRLVNLFFPESKGYISKYQIVSIQNILSIPSKNLQTDFSCDYFGIISGTHSELKKIGGFEGSNDEIYARIIKYTSLDPQGRVLVIPDALCKICTENNQPFVCDISNLPTRLNEDDCFFDESHDRILLFESGEVICIDHDLRLFWTSSKIRRFNRKRI